MNLHRALGRVLIVSIAVLMLSPTTKNVVFASTPYPKTDLHLSLPKYEWKFLSTSEKAAVDASLDVLRHLRIKNVTLNIVDENGSPYTGPVRVAQDSTAFIFWAGDPDWPAGSNWSDYIAMTPSKTLYMNNAGWKTVESSKDRYDLGPADYDYEKGRNHGIVDFHILMGPDMGGPFPETPPSWALQSDYDTFRTHLQKYVELLVTHFASKIHYYIIWDEANAWYGNDAWPIERIIEIMKLEASTIRSIDPQAKLVVGLTDISPVNLKYFEQGHRDQNWTTEDFAKRLIAADVPFDVIGIDSCYSCQPWPERAGDLRTLYDRLTTLAQLGRPIYIWETGPVSYIAPQYRWKGIEMHLWKGLPTEEKQAEYALAETIILLGQPLTIGVRFNILYDNLRDPNPLRMFQGLIYANGTKKQAFYALQNLWVNLTTNRVIQSTAGTTAFSGLAGGYTLYVEDYRPIRITLERGTAASFKLQLVPLLSTTTSTHATGLSQPMMAPNALLTTPTGNILLAALGMTIAIAVAIMVHTNIKRSSQN